MQHSEWTSRYCPSIRMLYGGKGHQNARALAPVVRSSKNDRIGIRGGETTNFDCFLPHFNQHYKLWLK